MSDERYMWDQPVTRSELFELIAPISQALVYLGSATVYLSIDENEKSLAQNRLATVELQKLIDTMNRITQRTAGDD